MVKLIIVHGPDGAGKSTQSKRLADAHGWHHISTGELCRNSQDDEILADLAEGKLIPSEKLQALLYSALTKLSGETVVLDGSPRKTQELNWLENLESKGEVEIIQCIIINVSEGESRKRLSVRGRNADTAEYIEKRLQWFQDDTLPVINRLKQRGLGAEVSGEGTPDEVFARLEEAVCVPS